MKKLLFMVFILSVFGGLKAQQYFDRPPEISISGQNLEELQRAKISNPNDPGILYNLGLKYLEQGSYRDALVEFKRANQIRPGSAILLAKVGETYNKLGVADSAVLWWEKALEQHYEYIEVWEKLVRYQPEYYFNLGVLYKDKAEEKTVRQLAEQAIYYFERYLEELPEGMMVAEVRSAKQDAEFFVRVFDSEQKKEERERAQATLRAQKEEELLAERDAFRTQKTRLVGLGFKTFNPSSAITFDLKAGKESLTNSIRLKSLTNSFTEWVLGGGLIRGPFIFRGGIMLGSSSVKQSQFPNDSIFAGDTSWVDNMEIKAVNIYQLEGEALYNFYYMNPLVLYISGFADVGYMGITQSEDLFSSASLFGAGLGLGIFLRMESWLIDFNYKRSVLGSSSGGMVVLAVYYKF
ncbi:hypothetical protein JW877_03515 [bacterium]|nr:hypothetical protein [bacterium]